jgi:malonyl-ACP decarboxylase
MTAPPSLRDRGVLVTGMAILHPLAETPVEFEAALRAGRSRMTAVPLLPGLLTVAALLDTFSVRAWAERHLSRDPAAATRLRAVAGRATLPVQSAACVALSAVLAAGLDARSRATMAVVIAGSNLPMAYQCRTIRAQLARPYAVPASHVIDFLDTDAVGAVSQVVGAQGEGCTVGAASASGTIAVIHAARLLAGGFADRCLVVAPVMELSEVELLAFQRSGAMAAGAGLEPERACRPFDDERAGFVYGQGAAAVVLETAPAAAERGTRPLAEILGYGQQLDARRGTAPARAGQLAAMRAALQSARLGPADVDYVNAHATGSLLGDEVEAGALAEVFGRHARVNSTKALTGHCLPAAGLIEAIAVIVQMTGQFRHANPWLSHPLTEDLDFVARAAEPGRVRTALTNSFAFSGINASLILGRTDDQ